ASPVTRRMRPRARRRRGGAMRAAADGGTEGRRHGSVRAVHAVLHPGHGRRRRGRRVSGRQDAARSVGGPGAIRVATDTRKEKRMSTQPSLYERLGGIYSIAAVVDDFIDRVMADARLNG